jgi:hypothetical protein
MKKSFALFAIAALGLAPVLCATEASACPSCKPTEQKQPADESSKPAEKKMILVSSVKTLPDTEESETSTVGTQLISDASKKAEDTCEKCGAPMKDGKCTKCGHMKKASMSAPKIAFA